MAEGDHKVLLGHGTMLGEGLKDGGQDRLFDLCAGVTLW